VRLVGVIKKKYICLVSSKLPSPPLLPLPRSSCFHYVNNIL